MKSLINISASGIVVALLAAMGYFTFQGSIVAWQHIEAIEGTTKVVLISVTLTALVLTLLLVHGMRSAARIRARSQLAERRQGLYAHILTVLRAVMDKEYSLAERQDLEAELMASHAEFMLLASSPTVKAYLALKTCLDKNEEEGLLDACFLALWKKMRLDLGFSNDYELFDIKDILNSLPGHGLLTIEKTQKGPGYGLNP